MQYLTLAERIRAGAAPEFFQTPSAPEFLHPSLHEPAVGEDGYDSLHSQRLLLQAQRIANELSDRGEKIIRSTRGAARQIICLTRIDPSNPTRLMRYRTVSDAAASVNQKCDNVSQAIRRNGTCGGHIYQYVCDLPPDFDEAATIRNLRKVQSSHQRGGRIFRSVPCVAAIAC